MRRPATAPLRSAPVLLTGPVLLDPAAAAALERLDPATVLGPGDRGTTRRARDEL